jgi:NAD(P)-dependent dehydrogenase (short-subunit alcohol dehydrogenase family)
MFTACLLGLQAFGRIDCLVSNAAASPTAAPLSQTPPDAIDKILDINIKSALLLVQVWNDVKSQKQQRLCIISWRTASQPQCTQIGPNAASFPLLLRVLAAWY